MKVRLNTAAVGLRGRWCGHDTDCGDSDRAGGALSTSSMPIPEIRTENAVAVWHQETRALAPAQQLLHSRGADCIVPSWNVVVPGNSDLSHSGGRGFGAKRIVPPIQEGSHL